jgi:hypothetical protein
VSTVPEAFRTLLLVVLCSAAITPLVKVNTANRQTRTNNAFFIPFQSLRYEFFLEKPMPEPAWPRTGGLPPRLYWKKYDVMRAVSNSVLSPRLFKAAGPGADWAIQSG